MAMQQPARPSPRRQAAQPQAAGASRGSALTRVSHDPFDRDEPTVEPTNNAYW